MALTLARRESHLSPSVEATDEATLVGSYTKVAVAGNLAKIPTVLAFSDLQGRGGTLIPTIMAYGVGIPPAPPAWGYEAESHIGAQLLRYFKYFLFSEDHQPQDTHIPGQLTEAAKTKARIGRSTAAIMGGYVSYLWQAIEQRVYGATPYKLVVTHPTEWPRDRLRSVINITLPQEVVNDNNVSFLTEAEAALEGILCLLQYGFLMVTPCGVCLL